MKLTNEQEQLVTNIMQERGLTRKSAVQFARRQADKLLKECVIALATPAVPEPQPAPAVESGTVIAIDGAPTVNPSDPGSGAAAKANAKGARKAAKAKKAAKPKSDAPKGKPGRKSKLAPAFDAAKAVELYKGGTKVVDIAVAMGYPRTKGQNRVRVALMAAGVYKGKGGE